MNIACWRRDERGFTLIEMLLVLSISLLLLFLFPSLMKTIATGHDLEHDSSEDVTVFFNHLVRDVREAVAVEVGPDRLHIDKGNGQHYLIERMSSKQIRRLRNGAGHVLMLEQVESFSCYSRGQLVRCKITLENGDKVTRSMAMLYPSISKED